VLGYSAPTISRDLTPPHTNVSSEPDAAEVTTGPPLTYVSDDDEDHDERDYYARPPPELSGGHLHVVIAT
jgi:hypothetical protein